jgi:hypothetical protein
VKDQAVWQQWARLLRVPNLQAIYVRHISTTQQQQQPAPAVTCSSSGGSSSSHRQSHRARVVPLSPCMVLSVRA